MQGIWRDVVRAAVEEATPYSFGDPQRITDWAALFVDAHQAAPGGLSIEIGTWRGGTALVFLRLLERLYPVETRPMLFTVDPYGDRPYNGGDGSARPALYGNQDYLVMKRLLARFANHAHFYMESAQFLGAPPRYWWQGWQQHCDGASFVLVDGEHDAESIARDVDVLRWRMAPGGIMVIDNVDNDPVTLIELNQIAPTLMVKQARLKRPDHASQLYAVLRPAPIAEAACR